MNKIRFLPISSNQKIRKICMSLFLIGVTCSIAACSKKPIQKSPPTSILKPPIKTIPPRQPTYKPPDRPSNPEESSLPIPPPIYVQPREEALVGHRYGFNLTRLEVIDKEDNLNGDELYLFIQIRLQDSYGSEVEVGNIRWPEKGYIYFEEGEALDTNLPSLSFTALPRSSFEIRIILMDQDSGLNYGLLLDLLSIPIEFASEFYSGTIWGLALNGLSFAFDVASLIFSSGLGVDEDDLLYNLKITGNVGEYLSDCFIFSGENNLSFYKYKICLNLDYLGEVYK